MWPWIKYREKNEALRVSALVYSEQKDEHFVASTSDWEAVLDRNNISMTKLRRQILVGTLTARKINGMERSYYLSRWSKGFFDCVTQRYFVMVDVIVPTLSGDPSILVDEVDVKGSYNGGRDDMNYDDVLSLRWGFDPLVKTCVASRDKINGSRFVRKGDYLYGCVTLKLPSDCPSELVEWTWQGLHILYPFALPAHDLDGMSFLAHPWTSLKDYVPPKGEGSMLLFHHKGEYTEKRLKRIPTGEVDLTRQRQLGLYEGCEEGVWEVSWNYSTKRYVPVRPRPGKTPSYKLVSDFPRLVDFATCQELVVPSSVINSVEECYTGSYRGAFLQRITVLVIDSGYRCCHDGWGTVIKVKHCSYDPVPVPHWASKVEMKKDLVVYSTPDGGIVAPRAIRSNERPMCITGAKVLFFRINQGQVEIAVVQDYGKGWDCLGGKIEPGESTVECVLREGREEAGIEIYAKSLVCVGISSYYDRVEHGHKFHKEYHSFLFVAEWRNYETEMPIKWLRQFDPPPDSVEWLGRLLQYIEKVVGTIDMMVPWYMGQTGDVPRPVVVSMRSYSEAVMWKHTSHGSLIDRKSVV